MHTQILTMLIATPHDHGDIVLLRVLYDYEAAGGPVIPYSRLFPWGANFRYFRGSP